jgi:hypothetical protein
MDFEKLGKINVVLGIILKVAMLLLNLTHWITMFMLLGAIGPLVSVPKCAKGASRIAMNQAISLLLIGCWIT